MKPLHNRMRIPILLIPLPQSQIKLKLAAAALRKPHHMPTDTIWNSKRHSIFVRGALIVLWTRLIYKKFPKTKTMKNKQNDFGWTRGSDEPFISTKSFRQSIFCQCMSSSLTRLSKNTPLSLTVGKRTIGIPRDSNYSHPFI